MNSFTSVNIIMCIYSVIAHKYEKNVKRKVKYPSTKSLSCGPLSIEVTIVAGGLEWPCIEPMFFLTIVDAILHKLAACAASQFNFFVHTISTVIGRVIIVCGISKNETGQGRLSFRTRNYRNQGKSNQFVVT